MTDKSGSPRLRGHPPILQHLGTIQLLTIFALITAVFVSILLLRHQTDDYFSPLTSYLLSIKVAVPPLAIFLFTYVFAFVTGTALTDAPKAALSFARNTFFQSLPMMSVAIVASVAFLAYSTWILAKSAPPAYESLVKLLLEGSSDNLAIARQKIAVIQTSNPDLAAHLDVVAEVFAERYAVNAGQHPLSGDRSRIFVRTLEADADGDWAQYPLRIYALAEAYSMFGQGVGHAATVVTDVTVQDPTSPFKRAVDLYTQIKNSSDPLVPKAMRVSALVNMGNAYYYMKDYAGALGAWRDANSSETGQPNLSPWSNVIAALVALGRPRDAVEEGERARLWAEKTGKALIETYPFAGVLENMAYAKMQMGDNNGTLTDFATANAFRDDDLTRQNLALALIVTGRFDQAQNLLREIAPPAEPSTPPGQNVARCVYLIWGLAMLNERPPARAANFYAFLGEHHSADEINGTTGATLTPMMRKVALALPSADLPCGSLSKVDYIMRLLPS